MGGHKIEIQGYNPEVAFIKDEADACGDSTGFKSACHLESLRLIAEPHGHYGVKITLGGRTAIFPDLHNLIAALQRIKQ